MKFPKIVNKKHYKYKLIKEYKEYGLYRSQYGFRECFHRFDLGMIPIEFEKVHYIKKNPVI